MDNSMDINFKKFVFSEKPENFYNWCLENNLHKEDNFPLFISHIRQMYLGAVSFTGLTSVVAYSDEKPIAILHCEHDNTFRNACILKDDQDRPTIHKRFGWGFYNLGFINIYVKKQYRNQSIATSLWNIVEEERIRTLIEKLKKENKSFEMCFPAFQAQELSYTLIEKKALYSYVTKTSYQDYFNYSKEISELTKEIIIRKNGLLEQCKIRERQSLENFSLPQNKLYCKSIL